MTEPPTLTMEEGSEEMGMDDVLLKAQRRGPKVTTVMVKENELEQGSWTRCSQELPSNLNDSVILYERQFTGVLQSQRE